MLEEKAPCLRCWDVLLIPLLFHPVAGELFLPSPGLLRAHLCSKSLMCPSSPPLLSAAPPSATTRRDDGAKPASSSPRGLEPHLAQPPGMPAPRVTPKPST